MHWSRNAALNLIWKTSVSICFSSIRANAPKFLLAERQSWGRGLLHEAWSLLSFQLQIPQGRTVHGLWNATWQVAGNLQICWREPMRLMDNGRCCDSVNLYLAQRFGPRSAFRLILKCSMVHRGEVRGRLSSWSKANGKRDRTPPWVFWIWLFKHLNKSE